MSEEIRAIREGEYAACLDLWCEVFSRDGRPYFERYFFGDHDFQNDYTRVCIAEGRIVSAVHLVKRVVACGEFTLTMGGVANVATLPEFRGRHCNTACLQQAMAVIEADAMDFGLLGTGIPDYYARLGWEVAPTSYLGGAIRPDLVRQPTEIALRPYAAQDDADIQEIYAEFNRTRPITVRRSAPYWRDWARWSGGSAPHTARVAVREGRVVGYSLTERRRERLGVHEIGVRADAEEALFVLLEDAAWQAHAQGLSQMGWGMPQTEEVRSAAQRLFAKVEERPLKGWMVWFPNIESLLRGLAPELTDRWMRAGSPPGRLRFSSHRGVTGIAARQGLLQIENAASDASDALTQADLFALLTGRPALPAALSVSDAAFARALFPPVAAWYWDLDGF